MNRDPGSSAYRWVPVPEQAAQWLLELTEPELDEARRRQFINWLKVSPQHVQEFLAVESLQQEVSEQSSCVADLLDEISMLQDAVPMPTLSASSIKGEPGEAKRSRWHYSLWAGAAACLLGAIFLLQQPGAEGPADVHRTERGEQRSILLNDGSIVTLNTLSELTVHMNDRVRKVRLVSGEAMFDVAADPERPFIVETAAISLHVLGTRFSVYLKEDSSRVAVVEGTVRALSITAPGVPVVLRAGEGVTATAAGVVRAGENFDVEKATAWTQRRLIFDGAPLAEVAREFNRYNRIPLLVEDKALARRAITTVFNANDVNALVRFLMLEPDVEVQYGDDAIRIRVKR